MSTQRRFVLLHIRSVRLVIVGALVVAPFTWDVVRAFPGSTSSPKSDPPTSAFLVGDGTPSSCTQDAIQTELNAAGAAGGGRIFFNCGPDPVTIPISAGAGAPLSLPDNTTIDGSGRITLLAITASGTTLSVDAGATVVLRNLAIVGGGGLFDAVANSGSLTLSNCVLSGFHAGVISSTSVLIISHSTFSDNGAFLTSPVRIISGTASVNRSVFSNNTALVSGAIANGGTLDVANSRFTNNFADSSGTGGAIGNAGVLTIDNTEFSGNLAGVGGALSNGGSMLVRKSTFSDNRGVAGGGGGIVSGGTMTIRDCDLLNNSANGIGGALLISAGVTVVNSTFSGNYAHGGNGGAIYTSADVLSIRGSTVVTNTADGDGGGIYVVSGSLVQHNNLIINNTPNDIGGSLAVSTAALSSGRDPGASSEWLKSQILYGLTVSPDDVAAWRVTLRQHLQP